MVYSPYNSNVGSDYDRRAYLYKMTETERAAEQANLDRLKAYATGQQSTARDIGAAQTAQQQAAMASAGQSAQRGGRDMAAQRTSAYAADQGALNIRDQSAIAQQLEQQNAAKAYSSASASALQNQLGLEKMARLYQQLGIQDQDAQAKSFAELERIRQMQSQAAYTSSEAKKAQDAATYLAIGNAASSFGGVLGNMLSDRRVKQNVAPADADLAAFLDALAGGRR